jgi:hypothetical protein
MQRQSMQKFWGIALIITGLLFYFNNLNYIPLSIHFFLGAGIILLGLFLITKYNQTKQIRFIGLGLLFIDTGLIIFVNGFPNVPENVSFAIFLLYFCSLSLVAFFEEPEKWWSIIPGAVVFIIAVILTIDAYHLMSSGMLWFVAAFGVSLIFYYLYLIRTPENKLDWSKYPASIIFLLSLYLLSTNWENKIASTLFPVSLILLGLYYSLINLKNKSKATHNQPNQENSTKEN